MPTAAEVAVRAVIESAEAAGSVDLVRFVLFSPGALETFEAAYRDAS